MLSEILKKLRRQKGISQEAVARAIFVSRNAYRDIEIGKTKSPALGILINLANLYGVSLDDLVGRNTSKKKDPKRPMVMLPLDKVGEKAKHSG